MVVCELNVLHTTRKMVGSSSTVLFNFIVKILIVISVEIVINFICVLSPNLNIKHLMPLPYGNN